MAQIRLQLNPGAWHCFGSTATTTTEDADDDEDDDDYAEDDNVDNDAIESTFRCIMWQRLLRHCFNLWQRMTMRMRMRLRLKLELRQRLLSAWQSKSHQI